MRLHFPPFPPASAGPFPACRALRCGLYAGLLGCGVLVAGCAGMNEDGTMPRHLPRADMTEAYPKTPFRELHHPPPPYMGGMVPMVSAIQPTPDEATGRSVHTSESDSLPHFPPQTQTDVSYGPPASRQKQR